MLFEDAGIQNSIIESINKCNTELSNIIVTGGSSRLKGFTERLQHELNNLMPNRNLKIIEKNDIESAVWLGGSILASCSPFEKMCISANTFQELGRKIIHTESFL